MQRPQYIYQAYTHPGKIRNINEDVVKLGILQKKDQWNQAIKLHYFILADGMGGLNYGDIASAIVVDSIIDHLNKLPYLIDEDYFLEEIFENAIYFAHENIAKFIQEQKTTKNMGSTLAALFITNSKAYIYWIGDSRIYLYRKNSNLSLTGIGYEDLNLMTRDDSMVWKIIEDGVLSLDQARNHPLSSVLTRSMGASTDADFSKLSIPIYDGDKFFICSDGVYQHMEQKELYLLLADDKTTIHHKAENLIDTILSRGAKDNFSFVLVNCNEEVNTRTVNADTTTDHLHDTKKSFFPNRTEWAIAMILSLGLFFTWQWIYDWRKNENDAMLTAIDKPAEYRKVVDTNRERLENFLMEEKTDNKSHTRDKSDMKSGEDKNYEKNKAADSQQNLKIKHRELEKLRLKIQNDLTELGQKYKNPDIELQEYMINLESMLLDLNILEAEINKSNIIKTEAELLKLKNKYGQLKFEKNY